MDRLGLLLVMSAALGACAADEDKNTPPIGMTGTGTPVGSASTTSGSGGDTDTNSSSSSSSTGPDDEGGSTDGDGCDPYGDHLDQCGEGRACSYVTQECYDKDGTDAEGSPCTADEAEREHDSCAPGLTCVFTETDAPRCVKGCMGDGPTCDEMQVCVEVTGTLSSGLCLQGCSLVDQDCVNTADACYPSTVGGRSVGTCLPPTMTGGIADPCVDHRECASGFACVEATGLTITCGMDEELCCSELCDTGLNVCAGGEPNCISLGAVGEAAAGICGTL